MKRLLPCSAVALALCTVSAKARFLSADPIATDLQTGRNFNRHAYAHNAPFNYVDPDGRWGRRPFHQGESAPVLPTGGPPIAVLPTETGIVTSPFGLRRHPLTGAQHVHDGTDFRARQEARILSTQNGQVRSIFSGGPGGNQILVDNHDGSLSGYAHIAADRDVSEGGTVTRGQVIGTSDGSGRLTAPHLHYTYRPGTLQDPALPATLPVDPMKTQLKRFARDEE